MANAEGDGSESKETECDSESEGNGIVRRPMNAFLIFCKRHRSLVREKYPHMENRSITKILGEWWANLEAEEKVTYTDLAKQYKEAFMKANPDFRWYKLPAPISRTLVTRPSNQRSSKSDVRFTATRFDNCGITPGKLADETQLGGLNSLMTRPCSSSSSSSLLSKPPKKRYLHNGAFVTNDLSLDSDPQTSNACSALLELASICSSKGRSKGEDDDSKDEKTVSNQQLINCIIEKSIGSSQHNGSKLFDDQSFRNCRKSERKGKGKRYQALLTEGVLQPPKDRRATPKKPDEDDCEADESKPLNLDAQIAALPRCSLDALIERKRKSDDCDKSSDASSDCDPTDETDGKPRFQSGGFDLEKQIAALPSLDIDLLNQRKKQQRHRPTSAVGTKGLNKKGNNSPEDESNRFDARPTLVGSQKRKARKRSITHLDPSCEHKPHISVVEPILLTTLATKANE